MASFLCNEILFELKGPYICAYRTSCSDSRKLNETLLNDESSPSDCAATQPGLVVQGWRYFALFAEPQGLAL